APPPAPMPASVAEAPAAGTSAAAPAPQRPQPEPPKEAGDKKEDSRRDAGEEIARVENQPKEKRADQPGAAENQQTPDGSRNKAASPAYGGGAGRERTNRSLSGPRARGDARAAEAARDGEDAASAGETRSAAGHRFRREGGAWVDVNYRPTMAMTGVRRGTEAYRALVADLPELGRIAEQLGGEVIAVVRGRAYRIR
ncbi:MAG TPA: hypothetical protein VG148_11300, partial [Pyrinomonadaceae bacterium]|nr:hypothetical protein [Pyrinomonadaceae bacterium]